MKYFKKQTCSKHFTSYKKSVLIVFRYKKAEEEKKIQWISNVQYSSLHIYARFYQVFGSVSYKLPYGTVV